MRAKINNTNNIILFLLYIISITTFLYWFNSKNKNIKQLDNNFKYTICDSENSSFKVKQIVLDPAYIERGKNTSITIFGELEQDIVIGSHIFIEVKYKMINLLKKRMNLCDELDKSTDIDMKCPVKNGIKNLYYEFNIPDEVPNGEYLINILLKNVDESKIFCSIMNIRFDEKKIDNTNYWSSTINAPE